MEPSPDGDLQLAAQRRYQQALSTLNSLPDHCAADIGELAVRIGADKLDLINWMRSDIGFARLIAAKVAS